MKTFLHTASGKSFFKQITTILFILASFSGFSVTKTAICTGNYDNAATWSPAGKPCCGDNVRIPAGITVSLTTTENYYEDACSSAMQFTVAGTFYFTQTSRLSLPCNSEIWVLTGGLVDGENNDNSQRIFICDVEVWRGRDDGAGYKYWFVGVLPIELVNFDVAKMDKKNVVKWETATEFENDYFEIERSEDGVNFHPIKKVNTKAINGTSISPIAYEMTDENVLDGTSYYRLKQIDVNKKINFSRIIAVERNSDNEDKFLIYPNPNNGKFFIDLKGKENNKDVAIKIFDNRGKLIKSYATDVFAIQSKEFDKELGEFNEAGIYLVVFTMDDKNYFKKLVLQ